jgi:topoisomerase-4 subunit B
MAMDEFQMGFGKGFSVELKNDYAVVRDYGRGIPLESVVSTTSGISVGIGANPKEVTVHPVKVTNALSIDFYVASYRDGECSWAKYSKGNLLEKGIEKTAEDNGTYIKFCQILMFFLGVPSKKGLLRRFFKVQLVKIKGCPYL